MQIRADATDLLGIAAAVDAASRAGVFTDLLANGAVGSAALCERLGLSARGFGAVAEVLLSLGLLTRDAQGRWSVGAEAAALEQRMPGAVSLAGTLFAGAPSLLETGAPVIVMDGAGAERAAVYSQAVSGLAGLFQGAAGAFAEQLGPVAGAILDVGCGSGIWSLAVARRSPSASVTGLDLPGVAEVFLRHAADAGLADRARAWSEDAHSFAFPRAEFDLVILANVLRLEPAARAASLVARAGSAVKPGGRLVIIDALAEGTAEKDVARAVYGLHLALRTTHGTVHAPSSIAAWLQTAGFPSISRLDFGHHPGAVAAIIGRR